MTDRTGPVPRDQPGRDAMVTAVCAAVDRADAEAFGAGFENDAIADYRVHMDMTPAF